MIHVSLYLLHHLQLYRSDSGWLKQNNPRPVVFFCTLTMWSAQVKGCPHEVLNGDYTQKDCNSWQMIGGEALIILPKCQSKIHSKTKYLDPGAYHTMK